jgi:hypothetical protein
VGNRKAEACFISRQNSRARVAAFASDGEQKGVTDPPGGQKFLLLATLTVTGAPILTGLFYTHMSIFSTFCAKTPDSLIED